MPLNQGGFTYPLSDAQAEVPNDSLLLSNSIGIRTIQRFANAAARDGFYTSPVEGQLAWLLNTHMMTEYIGGAWYEKETRGALLPNTQSGYGAGANNITAISASVLPTFTANVVMTNPHLTRKLYCKVVFSCWLIPNGAIVRGLMTASGGFTLASGPPIANAWGMIPYSGDIGNNVIQRKGTFYCELNANSSTTFAWKAYRDAAVGAPQLNYPTTRVIPMRYTTV